MDTPTILDFLYAEFGPSVPEVNNGNEPTPQKIIEYGFAEGFKLGMQLAAESLIH